MYSYTEIIRTPASKLQAVTQATGMNDNASAIYNHKGIALKMIADNFEPWDYTPKAVSTLVFNRTSPENLSEPEKKVLFRRALIEVSCGAAIAHSAGYVKVWNTKRNLGNFKVKLNFNDTTYRVTFNTELAMRFMLTKIRCSKNFDYARQFDRAYYGVYPWAYFKDFVRYKKV